jgi:hypothetical protein
MHGACDLFVEPVPAALATLTLGLRALAAGRTRHGVGLVLPFGGAAPPPPGRVR